MANGDGAVGCLPHLGPLWGVRCPRCRSVVPIYERRYKGGECPGRAPAAAGG